ncbi:phage SPO1 DNA polymerase-related protein [Thermodesulfatator indicus DSM 15286]|uniref:Type-4 uracil-DNA glycosylase n=1 Tax=Thermodesulfatator indicus (strain DSM 15286 / JCM 11887 / CIR29812) TaxID=667014 RepID=F8ADN2_THEID|nr:uracil-DNA glycosylase [Thermodesulfatator indicus]AEH44917.1 phage SPO1 DNA polymerase-related protein [Thermodesulfatator indicus DSM 15286]
MVDVWEDLLRYLEFLKRIGVNTLPARKNIRRFLDLDFTPPPKSLAEIEEEIKNCTRCKLHRTRKNIVLGEGPETARLMFIGEAPGKDEDLEGRPFVGRAGQLLDQMLNTVGINRSEVYITNVVKCRPPGNRTPQPDEIEACLPYLTKQIKLIRPAIICTLGRVAAQTVLATTSDLGSLRGKIHKLDDIKVLVTYHPAYLLRNNSQKSAAFEDLKLLKKLYGDLCKIS